MSLNRFDEAVLAYDQAISLDANSSDAWYNKGNALKSIGKYDEAIRAYDEVIRLDPSYADAWQKKAAALSAIGRYDESTLVFNEALNISNRKGDSTTNGGSSEEIDGPSTGISVSYKGPGSDRGEETDSGAI
jgi:tetratricopeptide (TPR) repeat protein